MMMKVLDPRVDPEGEALRLAPPLATLDGAVVGFIDNAKIGTERFFDFVCDILTSQHGVREVIRRRKPDATRPVAAGMLAELSGADAIVSAIGD